MQSAEPVIILLWTLASIFALRRAGFFRIDSLEHAPQRRSVVGLLVFGGVILFYISFSVIAFNTAKQLFPSPTEQVAATAASQAVTTIPATTSAPATTAASSIVPVDYFSTQRTIIAQSITGLMAAAFAIFAAGRLTVGGIRAFGLDFRQFIPGVLIGLLAVLIMAPWMILLQNLVIHLSERLRGGPLPMHPVLTMLKQSPPESVKILLVISAVCIAPIVEEIIFRGMLQTALLGQRRATATWRWATIFVASVVFTSIHIQTGPGGINWEHLPPLILLSCTLGYLYERTGSLWPSIALHALFNGFVTAQTLLTIDGH